MSQARDHHRLAEEFFHQGNHSALVRTHAELAIAGYLEELLRRLPALAEATIPPLPEAGQSVPVRAV